MTSTDESITNQYVEILQSDKEPSYYAQVPSVIFYCTYIETKKDGSKERKKLSSNAIALYTLLKSVSGQNGSCWMNTETLGDMLNRATGTISAAKTELQQPMEQLGGKPLIQVEMRKKKIEGHGATQYHRITVEFIWPENNAYMKLKKHMYTGPLGPIDNPENDASRSTIEGEEASRSTIESDPPGSRSIIETNNNQQNKNPSVKITEPTADADSVCSHIDPVSVKEQENELMEKAKSCMKTFGCDDNMINEMSRKYSARQIIDAGVYTTMQMKRDFIKNPIAYLRRAIEKSLRWQHSNA